MSSPSVTPFFTRCFLLQLPSASVRGSCQMDVWRLNAGSREEEEAESEAGEAMVASADEVDDELEAAAPELALVDVHVAPDEVLRRIDSLVDALVAALASDPPCVPPFELRRAGGAAATKRLFCRRDALSVIRLWRLLSEVSTHLRAGRSATQRELFYALKDGVTVKRAAETNASVSDAVRLLSVPRNCLGVTCASRGSVAGQIAYRASDDAAWTDLGGGGSRSIPGDLSWVARLNLRTDAGYVLLVEKDAVFNRLLQVFCLFCFPNASLTASFQERLCQRLGCVMITARGQPDLASRALAKKIADHLGPAVPVVGLFDWNPHGALIFSTFRGSAHRGGGLGLEAARFGVDCRWLACRAADVAGVPDDRCVCSAPALSFPLSICFNV